MSLNREGIIMEKLSWGLGRKSNNQVEMYSIFLGLTLTSKRGIKYIPILDDSFLIIHHPRTKTSLANNMLSLLFHRIITILKYFSNYSPYDILWSVNNDVDLLANRACLLVEGQVETNGIIDQNIIP